MKIAIVWNYPSRLLDCSFRFEQYVAGLRTLGHEPMMVTTRASAEGGGFDVPINTVDDAKDFCDALFWRQLGAEVALITTWLGMPEVLAAIRAAGVRVVAISDSDGQMGLIAHPKAGLERLLAYRDGALDTARRLKYFLDRQRLDRVSGTEEDRVALASIRNSDAVSICHSEGVRHLRSFLAFYGAEELIERVRIVPFTIGASYLVCPVPETKDDRVVAVGRWDDPQKNAPLLTAAVARFARRRPQTEVVLLGGGGEPWFEPLARRYPSVSYPGTCQQEELARLLASSRVFLGTSRWESGPMAVTEALVLGATIVGNPIPSYISYTENGQFGTVASRSTPRAVANALEREMEIWDRGEREGRRIAETWRQRMAPEELCRRLLSIECPAKLNAVSTPPDDAS
jgi:glycosyltransferase involved in cell wall biosynthesis